jgi:hypothetical protein
MIVSASRRADIPAFYAEWMVRRLGESYCTVPNPFDRNQVSRIAVVQDLACSADSISVLP